MNWAEQAAKTGGLVFPIRIYWDAAKEKWQKVPLTKRGHLDASRDVIRFNWSQSEWVRLGDG